MTSYYTTYITKMQGVVCCMQRRKPILCRVLFKLNLINIEKAITIYRLFDEDQLLYEFYLTLHTLTFQNEIEKNIADV